ncbi:MAG: hypothetical protein QM535_19320 [Limnohabitans sp.]|nr:hypothetical protein [Limnohabitans sp.]
MSDKVKKNLESLVFISKLKNIKTRKKILSLFVNDKSFCDAIREIVLNTINKVIPLSAIEKKKLKPYKKVLLNFNKRRKNNKKRIIQSGGFLPILIPILLSLLKI